MHLFGLQILIFGMVELPLGSAACIENRNKKFDKTEFSRLSAFAYFFYNTKVEKNLHGEHLFSNLTNSYARNDVSVPYTCDV